MDRADAKAIGALAGFLIVLLIFALRRAGILKPIPGVPLTPLAGSDFPLELRPGGPNRWLMLGASVPGALALRALLERATDAESALAWTIVAVFIYLVFVWVIFWRNRPPSVRLEADRLILGRGRRARTIERAWVVRIDTWTSSRSGPHVALTWVDPAGGPIADDDTFRRRRRQRDLYDGAVASLDGRRERLSTWLTRAWSDQYGEAVFASLAARTAVEGAEDRRVLRAGLIWLLLLAALVISSLLLRAQS